MLIPAAVFLVVSMVFFAGALIILRSGQNREDRGLGDSMRRPPMFGPLTETLAGAIPSSGIAKERLSRFLGHAGRYQRSALTEYLALRNALVIGWILLVVTFVLVATEPGDGWLPRAAIVGVIGTMVFYAVPRLMLEAMAKSRLQRIEGDLPDALDMITMCMTGGLPLPVAVSRVSEELGSSHADLAFELRIVGRHMEAGSLDGALRRFAKRIDTPEVQSLAAIIGQTEIHGASVGTAFHDFADNVRTSRRQRADELGNKTALKLLFPLVFCLAPPVYMLLLAPAAIELKTFVEREREAGGVLSVAPDNFNDVFEGRITIGDTIEDFPPPDSL